MSTDRSALVVTVAVSLPVLLAGFGSNVRPVTTAVLVKVVPAGVAVGTSVTTVITGRLDPAASVSVGLVRWQVMVWPAAAQDQPVPVADERVTPLGRVSVTTNGPTAVSAPALVTLTVQVACPPATVGSTWTLVRVRSAESIRVCAVAGPPL